MTHKVAGSTMQHSNQGTSGCRFIKSSTGYMLSLEFVYVVSSHFVLSSVR